MSVEEYAKKTFVALLNPYHTVVRVFPSVIDYAGREGCAYLGVKDSRVISPDIIGKLEKADIFLHTYDVMSRGGRAVDQTLTNPLTLRVMTGSSSGTALNVLYRINDIGLGTDGGGSVLAPAAGLNLFAFIAPSIGGEHARTFLRTSTDGIAFTPSLGFITRDLEMLKRPLSIFYDIVKADYNVVSPEEGVDIYGPRQPLIDYLKSVVRPGIVLSSLEGPVDRNGLGDSVFGNWDDGTDRLRRASGKGLMRVVNMAGLAALAVPTSWLGVTRLLIAEDSCAGCSAMLEEAGKITVPENVLSERYFGDLDSYFDRP